MARQDAFGKSYEGLTVVRGAHLGADHAGRHQEFELASDTRGVDDMVSGVSSERGVSTLDFYKPKYELPEHQMTKIHGSFGKGRKKPRKPSLEKEDTQPVGVNCMNWFYHGIYRDLDKYLKTRVGSAEACEMVQALREYHRTPVEVGERVIKTRYAQPQNLTTDGLPIGFVIE
jgi:hypothetical protein